MKMTFWQKAKALMTDRRLLVVLLLGFSSGLPLSLTGTTLQAWLTDAQLDVSTIGFFGLVGLPYGLKFLWAPFLDGFALPFLGLRRGWGLLSQLGLCASIIGLASLDPQTQIEWFSCMAFLVSFFSASQDIVVDAYRVETLEVEKFGLGAGLANAGYRVATVISGGAALILADQFSWSFVYLLMAALSLIGAIALYFSPEPVVERPNRKLGVKAIVIAPFVEFFQRSGAMEIMIFVMIYKLSTLMATALTTKFLMDVGYTKTMIGAVSKGPGLVMSIAGTLVGGSLMLKLGMKRSLWIFGLIQSLVGVTFWALIHFSQLEGHVRNSALITVIGMDQFMMGLGSAAIMGFMMTVSSLKFTGTQYALLSSLPAVTRTVIVSYAGVLVEKMGWSLFFLSTVPLAIPGLLLLYRFDHWRKPLSGADTSLKWYELCMALLFVISLISLTSTPLWLGLGLKDLADRVSYSGALGVVVVIMTALLIPLFTSRKLEAQ